GGLRQNLECYNLQRAHWTDEYLERRRAAERPLRKFQRRRLQKHQQRVAAAHIDRRLAKPLRKFLLGEQRAASAKRRREPRVELQQQWRRVGSIGQRLEQLGEPLRQFERR